MNDDQARRLFADLNEMPARPNPDFVANLRKTIVDESQAAVILNSQNRRSNVMDESTVVGESSHSVETISRSRRGLRLAGGLVAAGIVAVIGLQALGGSSSPDQTKGQETASTVEIAVEGLGDDPVATAAFAVVEAAYASHRAGDAEAWFDAISPGLSSMGNADIELERGDVARRRVLGDQIESISCRSLGQGQSDLAGDQTTATGFRFRCEGKRSDYFSEAAGTSYIETFDWVIADGEIIWAASEEENSLERQEFFSAFRRWIGNNHPDDFATVFISPSEDQLPRILALLDEFIAQSDQYPVDQ